MEQRINVNRFYIQVGNRIILKNYWYRYVSHLIQRVVVEEEDLITKYLGEEKYEQFFDWIELCAEEASSSETIEIEIPDEIISLGCSIEKIVIKDEKSWFIGDVECILPKEKIKSWSKAYFSNLILPYLQMDIEETVSIDGEVDSTCELFRYYLYLDGYRCSEQTESSKTVKKISIKCENTSSLTWVEGHEFIINSDVSGEVQVSVVSEMASGQCTSSEVFIRFPWYRKLDRIIVDITNTEGRWLVKSKNLNRNLEYVGEIEIC